ncbi:MAG: phosphoenolpyruvate carboxylase, partial [Bdellovibrionales bacterium]
MKKKPEHALFESIENSLQIVRTYADRLSKLKDKGIEIKSKDGDVWLDRLTDAANKFNDLRERLLEHKTDDDDIILSQQQYTNMLADVNGILKRLGRGADPATSIEAFKSDLNDAFIKEHQSGHPAAEDALLLSKMTGSFGWHFARLEYRQTAEEHSKMIHHLLQIPVNGQKYDYLSLDPDQRRNLLDKLYREDSEVISSRVRIFLESVDEKTVRGTNSVEEKTLNTIRLMQLFASQPHNTKRMVLAEFESGAHYLEAIMLQKACPDPNTGRTASLDVTPLVERPETLKDWKNLFEQIVTTPTTARHLYERGFNQYWQGAYSDNIKRFGVSTRQDIDAMWRGFPGYVENYIKEYGTRIVKALKLAGVEVANDYTVAPHPGAPLPLYKEAKGRAASANDNLPLKINIMPYHGSSLLRSDHDGQRASTAKLKDYSSYGVAHLGGIVYFDVTTQGRDNTAKLGAWEAVKRNETRIFSEGSQLAGMHREGRSPHRHEASEALTNLVNAALRKSQDIYEHNYAHNDSPHCHELADPIVNNDIEAKEGNGSSRSTFRAGSSQATKRNIYARSEDGQTTEPVSQEAMRAITLFEDQQHMGSRMAWLGTYLDLKHLNEGFRQEPALAGELKKFVIKKFGAVAEAFDDNGELTVQALQTLASPSVLPPFSKHKDEIGFGIKTSPLATYAWRQEQAGKQGKPMTQKVIQGLKQRIRDYMAGSSLVLMISGIDPKSYDRPGDDESTQLARRNYLISRLAMPLSSGELLLSQSFDILGTFIRDQIGIRTFREGNDSGPQMGDRPRTPTESRILRIIANARRGTSQPNAPTVHDFVYANDRMELLKKQRIAPRRSKSRGNVRRPARNEAA